MKPEGQSLTEVAYEAILGMILDGTLPGGARLQERRLADELKLSRTPVRDALSRLESEGLIIRQDRLSIVRTITVRDFFEILHVRKLLETEAVGLACGRIPAAELERLEAGLAATRTRGLSDRSFDEDLHGTILRYAGNDVLASMVLQLRKKTAMFDVARIPARGEPVIAEHAAILAALVAGDAAAARAAIDTHLENVRNSIIEWISGIGGPPRGE